MTKIAVIGGGAAGMFAAAIAGENGADVTLIEKNEKCGKKLYITGKGRCNVTNTATGDGLLAQIAHNPRFLMSAFSRFDGRSLMEYLESSGLPLKIERGGRVFPESEKASDVTKTLIRRMERAGVKILLETTVKRILTDGESVVSVETDRGSISCDAAIVCTGGLSYPATGSTGDGWRFAEETGHRTLPPLPSLLPIETKETWVRDVQGLSLKNVTLSANIDKKEVFSEQGEMLFTHFGIGGPLAISLSAVITGLDLSKISLQIDMKPALDFETLERRLVRDFEKYKNKLISNALFELLPRNMISIILCEARIEPGKPVNQISKGERSALVQTLKALPLTPVRLRPIEEAVITRGGVHTGDVDPKTMRSKKVGGLFFAGEVLDVDGFTGGFNLQIAFSTAYCAAMSAAGKI